MHQGFAYAVPAHWLRSMCPPPMRRIGSAQALSNSKIHLKLWDTWSSCALTMGIFGQKIFFDQVLPMRWTGVAWRACGRHPGVACAWPTLSLSKCPVLGRKEFHATWMPFVPDRPEITNPVNHIPYLGTTTPPFCFHWHKLSQIISELPGIISTCTECLIYKKTPTYAFHWLHIKNCL